ncbi:MORN repeat-containing protein [Sediminicola luteus]|uniref:MORN repeat protein n=1 Tax=Sediminicola luteus TaxID=319238 RepID=A0A2A4G7S1_9FLAO|nr:hypothetical protein [Sediminicola luteus]PCE64677.1 hypothetical protein B7P33_05760 [Sediminicola luteus]
MKFFQKFLSVGIIAIMAASLVFMGLSQNKTRTELARKTERINQLENRLQTEKQLWEADSLLLQGQYSDAMAHYKGQKENPISDGPSGVNLRLALAAKFLAYEKAAYQKNQDELENGEEPDTETQIVGSNINNAQLDSLSFALSKAQVQMAKLRKQLHEKSFGEYVTFTNAKGSQVHYVGKVKDGKAHGYGVAIFNTGSRYVGYWKNNQRHGQGTYYWKDGEYYEGQYQNDQRNGQGTYYWPKGEKYVGQWQNDQRSGKGAFYDKKGKIMTQGVWEKDELISHNSKANKKTAKKNSVAAL